MIDGSEFRSHTLAALDVPHDGAGANLSLICKEMKLHRSA
jgi:hypothetical protein